MGSKLNVQAIFDSIDGECNAFEGAGQLTTFVRLKGCNLYQYGGCSYCDTKYAQNSKPENWMSVDEIIERIHFPKVTITGGEPLLQWKNLRSLLGKLLHRGCKITIETNGSIDVDLFWEYENEYIWVWNSKRRLRYVVDFKLPSSGVMKHMKLMVFGNLREIDVIKFVISDKEDYDFARGVIFEHPRWIAKKVFSPAVKTKYVNQIMIPESKVVECIIDNSWPRHLAEMMISDKVDAQFSLQLHKVLWPSAEQER